MEIQDRRVRRTQHLLAKALIDLTLEKGYETVTIRDITERADIGYATFFRHYHAKDELLKDVLEVVLTELIDLLSPAIPNADAATVGVLLFDYVQKQSEIFVSCSGATHSWKVSSKKQRKTSRMNIPPSPIVRYRLRLPRTIS